MADDLKRLIYKTIILSSSLITITFGVFIMLAWYFKKINIIDIKDSLAPAYHTGLSIQS